MSSPKHTVWDLPLHFFLRLLFAKKNHEKKLSIQHLGIYSHLNCRVYGQGKALGVKPLPTTTSWEDLGKEARDSPQRCLGSNKRLRTQARTWEILIRYMGTLFHHEGGQTLGQGLWQTVGFASLKAFKALSNLLLLVLLGEGNQAGDLQGSVPA